MCLLPKGKVTFGSEEGNRNQQYLHWFIICFCIWTFFKKKCVHLEFLNEFLNKRKTGLVWFRGRGRRDMSSRWSLCYTVRPCFKEKKHSALLCIQQGENGRIIQISTAFLDHSRPQHHAKLALPPSVELHSLYLSRCPSRVGQTLRPEDVSGHHVSPTTR